MYEIGTHPRTLVHTERNMNADLDTDTHNGIPTLCCSGQNLNLAGNPVSENSLYRKLATAICNKACKALS